jgi:hypothetical protein
MRQSPFLLLLLLLAAAPSAAQQPTQAYVGCYRLLQGSWDPHLRSGFHPSPGQLPPAILLDSLPLAGWPMEYLQGARQARSLSLPNDRSFSFRFWQRLDPDTLFVARPCPPPGFYLKVSGPTTRLQGYVTSFTDIIREDVPWGLRGRAGWLSDQSRYLVKPCLTITRRGTRPVMFSALA